MPAIADSGLTGVARHTNLTHALMDNHALMNNLGLAEATRVGQQKAGRAAELGGGCYIEPRWHLCSLCLQNDSLST